MKLEIDHILETFKNQQRFDLLRGKLNTRVTYKISTIILLVIIITLLHYLTSQADTYFHVAYRELYFLPIILAGFWFGRKGGLLIALTITSVYGPLVFVNSNEFNSKDFGDFLEILLFNIIGFLVGWLQDRELLRQKIKQERDELVATGKAVACIAHDMKTPLIAIGGFAQRVRRKLPVEDTHRKYLDIVVQQTTHLESMVSDMLDFSKPLELKCKHNCLSTFFQETLTISEEKAKKHQVKLYLQLQDNLPHCYFDYFRIQQALHNLINNAVEASPMNGEVIIICEHIKDSLVIEVIDDGKGIPDTIINSFLLPFTSDKKEGTGLGLPIVKKITEAHGGTLQYERHDSKGMIFRLILP